jgi:hypothetical protein
LPRAALDTFDLHVLLRFMIVVQIVLTLLHQLRFGRRNGMRGALFHGLSSSNGRQRSPIAATLITGLPDCDLEGKPARQLEAEMRTRIVTWIAFAIASTAVLDHAQSQSVRFVQMAASEVYIQQSRGHVTPGSSIMTKPPPEVTTTTTASPSAAPTAPDTCNAQNASSQACYTATQQSRPAGR